MHVQQRITLPYTGPAPLRLFYRARVDVNGDGKPGLVILRKRSRGQGVISLTLTSGHRSSIETSSFAKMLPALVAVGNVDGRAGDELFVDVEHFSTNEFIGIYTYWKGQLRLAKTLPGYSAHPGVWAGMTCSTHGSRPRSRSPRQIGTSLAATIPASAGGDRYQSGKPGDDALRRSAAVCTRARTTRSN